MDYSILLIVEKPDLSDARSEGKWRQCVSALEGLAKKNTSVKLLAESTALIPLTHSLQGVADAINCVKGLKYRHLILNGENIVHEVGAMDLS